MSAAYEELRPRLMGSPCRWLVTGAAGFIGSHLVQRLLELDQCVAGLDNFCTGRRQNLDEVRSRVTARQWERFEFIEGDIRRPGDCEKSCEGVEYVFHEAALGSVPRSMEDPVTAHEINATGFLNVMIAARGQGVRRVVYASSSANYGDDPSLPKREDQTGRPLSPYAATKRANEIYAEAFANAYGLESVGLRYFNVFGPRQDPNGPYAAVIPRWITAILRGQPLLINGDGETSRDFCHIENVIQANLLAALASGPNAVNQVYNIAGGKRTTLNELVEMLGSGLRLMDTSLPRPQVVYGEFREGDVRHSLADIGKAEGLLGYSPARDVASGLEASLDWYVKNPF